MATVPVPAGEPFQNLVEVAARLAETAARRLERLVPTGPIPIDLGLCRDGIKLLRTLPMGAQRCGLAHGDFNPGNILRHGAAKAGESVGSVEWLAIDPQPVHGDLS
jgi:hypothetical protein